VTLDAAPVVIGRQISRIRRAGREVCAPKHGEQTGAREEQRSGCDNALGVETSFPLRSQMYDAFAHWRGVLRNILDFKQVFQFDSPQIFQILKIFRKMQTRYKIFQRITFFWNVFYHMLSNCSF